MHHQIDTNIKNARDRLARGDVGVPDSARARAPAAASGSQGFCSSAAVLRAASPRAVALVLTEKTREQFVIIVTRWQKPDGSSTRRSSFRRAVPRSPRRRQIGDDALLQDGSRARADRYEHGLRSSVRRAMAESGFA